MLVIHECKNILFISYLDTAKSFEKEIGSNISKYEVCDNIDLATILQVKFFEKTYTCTYIHVTHTV